MMVIRGIGFEVIGPSKYVRSGKVSGKGMWHEGEGSDDRREHCLYSHSWSFRESLSLEKRRVGLPLSHTQDSPSTIDFDYVE